MASSTESAGESSGGTLPKRRLASLDWFRFAAVALMIQGHTFYEVLREEVKSERWYLWHGYVHGFTAPMFYFSSGLAFGLTTLRSLDAHREAGRASLQRYERYVTLLLLGYGLSAGDFSLRALLEAEGASRDAMLAANTLHVLGVTLLFEQALVPLCRTRRAITLVSALALLVVVLAAPAAWRTDFPALPRFVAAYLTNRTGSLFPLLPWAGYVFAGVLTASACLMPDGRTLRADLARRVLFAGAALALSGKALGSLQLDVFGPHNYWKTSPFFFAQRLGVVMLVFGGLAMLEEVMRGRPSRVGRLVGTVAMETLVMYVGHLLVLYGTPWTVQGLKEIFHGSLGLGASAGVFAGLFAAMIALAWGWHELKARQPVAFTRARRAVTLGLVLVFVVNPGPGDDPPRSRAHDASAAPPASR